MKEHEIYMPSDNDALYHLNDDKVIFNRTDEIMITLPRHIHSHFKKTIIDAINEFVLVYSKYEEDKTAYFDSTSNGFDVTSNNGDVMVIKYEPYVIMHK